MDIQNRGKSVLIAGTGINLALGVLYTWSIFKSEIKRLIDERSDMFNWDPSTLNDPYAYACLVFAFVMIPAGRIQDRFGPGITAFIGGVLVGTGFIYISTSSEYIAWVIGFGFLVGAGLAFGYSSATPPALKWHPPHKTGMVTGIVVSGFGLASVYIAPVSTYLLMSYNIGTSMLILGISFFIIVSTLSTLLKNPPKGYRPPGFVERRGDSQSRALFMDAEMPPSRVLRKAQFWLLWLIYFIGAGAGLMVIGSLAGMAKKSLGANAFLAVAILAVGNASGRIIAGTLSDRFGRKRTLSIVFILQSLLMFIAFLLLEKQSSSAILVVLFATLVGFNYGANLSLFPSFVKDLYGIKHFGVNYGILFTAWGIGGFVMGRASEAITASTKSFSTAFALSGAMLVAGTVLIYYLKDHKEELRRARKPDNAEMQTG